MNRSTILKEWFWSESSARRAMRRMERMGYTCIVGYTMAADGRYGWLLAVY